MRKMLCALVIGGALVVSPPAHGSPGGDLAVTVCDMIDANPTTGQVGTLVGYLAGKGMNPNEIATVVATAVITACPWNRDVVVAYADAAAAGGGTTTARFKR